MRAPQWQMAALVWLVLPVAGAAAPAPALVPNPPLPGALQAADMLSRPVKFGGFDADPKMTLQEALDALADRYDLGFTVNDAAFAKEKVEDVLCKPVAVQAIPKMIDSRLADVLNTILARVPCPSGTTYLIRGRRIEITTGAAVRKELGRRDDERLPPLVTIGFDRELLGVALYQMSERSGFSIVVDGRAAEQAREPVTATLVNVPLDTAAALLADTAGLESVFVDNVCYITSAENAKRLRAKLERKHRGEAEAETKPSQAPATPPNNEEAPAVKGTAKGPGSPAPGTRRP